ncbi:hypothetical protein Scep_020649 [Stephania cephalantha]|uniref:U1 small nuclear ribonucleoprotein of 70kDa N-terminal domain-containing protein n=1 Tax=Stephania cephalantha TaxID=152367 RepID=A0AAP0IDI3_9MAGN
MGDFNDAFMRNQNNNNNNNAAVQARTKAQNRATVLQLKLIGQSHPTGLTNNLLKLFEPRAPLEFKPPPEKRKCPPYSGMAQFVSNFAEPGDPEYAPPVKEGETSKDTPISHQLFLTITSAIIHLATRPDQELGSKEKLDSVIFRIELMENGILVDYKKN